jgi:hypothetical protein
MSRLGYTSIDELSQRASTMSVPPPDYRDSLDPLFLERQRNRYASRGVAFLILLNGIAALILLASLSHLAPQVEDAIRVVDAMLVFGAGAAVALASTFFAYLRRTMQLRYPERAPLRTGLWWLSLLAALVAAACFLIGLNMTGRAVAPELRNKASLSAGAAKYRKDHDVSRAKRDKGERRKRKDKSRVDEEEDDVEARDSEKPEGVSPQPKQEIEEAPRSQPTEPQPLTRSDCENAGKSWSESTNSCN